MVETIAPEGEDKGERGLLHHLAPARPRARRRAERPLHRPSRMEAAHCSRVLPMSRVFAPATTPFDPVTGERGRGGASAATRAAGWRRRWRGLVLFGSTGEGLLLDEEERARCWRRCGRSAGARLLLAGAGAESTRAGDPAGARSAAEAGADAVLVQPPCLLPPAAHAGGAARALPGGGRRLARAGDALPGAAGVQRGGAGGRAGGGALAPPERRGDQGLHGRPEGPGRAGGGVPAGTSRCWWGAARCSTAALEVGACGGILGGRRPGARQSAAEIYRLSGRASESGPGRLQERSRRCTAAVVGGLGVPGVKAALDLLGLAGGAAPPPAPAAGREGRARVREALRAGAGCWTRRRRPRSFSPRRDPRSAGRDPGETEQARHPALRTPHPHSALIDPWPTSRTSSTTWTGSPPSPSHRPDKLNALERAARSAELGEAVRAAREDAAVRGVIVTGSGEQGLRRRRGHRRSCRGWGRWTGWR